MEVVRDVSKVPSGCGSTVLTSTISVHILVRVSFSLFSLLVINEGFVFFFQGLIDLDAEIAKSEKKLQLARLNLDKVRKVEAQSDYVETVPENVRSINEDRVRCYHDICSCALNFFINPLLTLQRKTLEAEISTLEASKEMFARLK